MSTWTIPRYSEGWTVPGFTERQELGRGASGRVVEAVLDVSGRQVAIKYLNPDLLTHPAVPQRFRAEGRRLVEYGDPQVGVRAYDYVEQPGEGAAIIVEPADWAALHELTEAALLPLLARSGDARPPAGAGGRGGHRFTVIASGTVAAVLIRDA